MPLLPSNDPVRRVALGIASLAFGMIMREVAARRRAASQPRPAPPADPEPLPQAAPEIVVRLKRPLPVRPLPPQAEPPAREGGVMTRPVSWGGWTFYLLARLSLVAFTIVVLEISSTSQVRGYFYFAVLPGIGALLIPYGRPRQRRNPIEGPGTLTACSALLAVAIWPWYFYATANAPLNPLTVISIKTFTLSPQDVGQGCIVLLDDEQHPWLINQGLRGSIKNNRITLYQTAFGWTPEGRPTQSPSPFLDIPHLNQIGYSLTPDDGKALACVITYASGKH